MCSSSLPRQELQRSVVTCTSLCLDRTPDCGVVRSTSFGQQIELTCKVFKFLVSTVSHLHCSDSMHSVRCVTPSIHRPYTSPPIGLSRQRSRPIASIRLRHAAIAVIVADYSTPDYRTAPYKCRSFLVVHLVLD